MKSTWCKIHYDNDPKIDKTHWHGQQNLNAVILLKIWQLILINKTVFSSWPSFSAVTQLFRILIRRRLTFKRGHNRSTRKLITVSSLESATIQSTPTGFDQTGSDVITIKANNCCFIVTRWIEKGGLSFLVKVSDILMVYVVVSFWSLYIFIKDTTTIFTRSN